MSEFKSENSTEFIAMGSLAAGYTVIPNPIMNNIDVLGADAFTVLVKILQFVNSPLHKISVQGLSSQLKISKNRISKAINRLREVGYINRVAKKRGNLTVGFTYLVYDTPIGNTIVDRNPHFEDSDTSDSDSGDAKKENINHLNIKKENKVVAVVSAKETQLLELYKTFDLEKRLTPHVKKLLLSYIDKIDLEVFEQIFIDASEDSVAKKYKYLKEILESLSSKGIRTLKQYEADNAAYKDSKRNASVKGPYTSKNSNKGIYMGKMKIDIDGESKYINEHNSDKFDKEVEKRNALKYANKLMQERRDSSINRKIRQTNEKDENLLIPEIWPLVDYNG